MIVGQRRCYRVVITNRGHVINDCGFEPGAVINDSGFKEPLVIELSVCCFLAATRRDRVRIAAKRTLDTLLLNQSSLSSVSATECPSFLKAPINHVSMYRCFVPLAQATQSEP
jgi:hypothetical protein